MTDQAARRRDRIALIVLCLLWLAIGVAIAVFVSLGARDGDMSSDLVKEFVLFDLALFGAPGLLAVISERAGGIGVLSGVGLFGAALLAFAYQPLILAVVAFGIGTWALGAFSKLDEAPGERAIR